MNLYLFAKEPVAGQVKTRLAPRLGYDQCARLARQMLQQSAMQVAQYWNGKLVLCVTPRIDAPLFREMADHLHCEIALQRGDDLGARMLSALSQGIQQSGVAVVMGCDVPHIPGDILEQASHALASGQNVIGPAQDGGFYLMGLHSPQAGLFEQVEWGGDQVLAKVMENSERYGVEFAALPVLRDIDLWDDLVWLAAQDDAYRQYLDSAENTS